MKYTALGILLGVMAIFCVLFQPEMNVPILDQIFELRVWVALLILSMLAFLGGIPDDLPIFKLSAPAIILIIIATIELYRLVGFEAVYEKVLTWIVMASIVVGILSYLGIKKG